MSKKAMTRITFFLVLVAVLVFLLLLEAAHAQPATQPATQPSVVSLAEIIAAWWSLHGAQVLTLLALLPSILTAITEKPKDGGAWSWVKVGMQIFSILTHRDADGTLKAPGPFGLHLPPSGAKE